MMGRIVYFLRMVALRGVYASRPCKGLATCIYFTLLWIAIKPFCSAQGVRFDHKVATIASNYPVGAEVPVMAIPNATVTICTDGNCLQPPAHVFSNQGLTVQTANPMKSDGQGNFGFWAAAGSYFYKVVAPTGTVLGIFPITLGGSGGTGGVTQIFPGTNITCSPNVGGNCVGGVTVNAIVPVVQVNGTPLITASPVNFINSPSVSFTNPLTGEIQATANLGLTMQVVPPIAGQYVVIYPTTGSSVSNGACTAGASSLSGWGVTGPHNSLGGACSSFLTWGSFSLPSFVTPANVTAIYAFAISSYPGTNPNTLWLGTCSDGTHTSGNITGNAGGVPYGITQATSLISGAAGSSVPSISCPFSGNSSVFTSITTTFLADKIGLIVYYTGTAPPVDNTLQLVPPLYINTTLNQMGVDLSSISSGFPFTLGSTSVAASSTVSAITGISVNGVTLNAAGSSTLFLNQAGGYTAPAGGAVASVANSDGTLTVTPTTGSVVASLNLAHANTWTAPISVAVAGGQGGTFDGTEGTAPTATAGHDIIYADAISHCIKYSANGGVFACLGTGGGSVTAVTGTAPIVSSGGTAPAVSCPTCITSAAALTNNALVIGGGLQASSTISADTVTTHALFATAGAPAFRAVAATDIPAALSSTTSVNGTTIPAAVTLAQTIASGTSALGTAAIASGACATVVTTTATGTASTDAISWNPNGSIKALTGYVPSTAGGLTIAGYPTANAVNWDVCNWTAASITPGAVTLNWRVAR